MSFLQAVTLSLALTAASAASASNAPKFSTIEPSLAEIQKAAATAATTTFDGSNYVKGEVFDRFYNVWLENTDFDKAAGQSGLKKLAEQGIVLTNYWALTHPSEPNYLASAGGDYFGLGDDEFITLPSNVSNIADLLDTKGISWAEYQEHQPYSGFQGFNFSNQQTYANDYVRKHNPLVLYDNVVKNETRLARLQNYTEFHKAVDNKALPQWAFITPNMTNDGHDSTIEVAGNWAYNFLNPLLQNQYFTEKTLVVLTFDENETYEIPNRIWAVLLGDIPEELKGTSDDTYYDHYSLLSTVEANWGLPNLGRGDCGANVFQIVANKTGFANKKVDTSGKYNNESAKGYLSDKSIPIPAPNLTCKGASGKGVLQAVIDNWGKTSQVAERSNASSSSNHSSNGSSNGSSSAVPSHTNEQTNSALRGSVAVSAVLIGAVAALL